VTDPEEIKKAQRRCAELQAEVDSLRSQLNSLIEVAVTAAKTDPQTVFDKVLERALYLTQARTGSLMLIEGERLRIITSKGLDPETARSSRPRLGQGVAGWVAEHGVPLLLGAEGDNSLPFALERPIKDALSVPLRFNETTVGVLNVNDSPPGRAFNRADLELLGAFASETALVVQILRGREEIESTYLSTIQALAEAIDAKDPYTAGHSRRVAEYAARLAEEMELPEAEVRRISTAALMHDIGKIGVSEEILRKPAALDWREYGLVQTHPVISAKILQPIRALRDLVPLIRHHHEHYDGQGYPAGLRAEEIPLGARVMAVVDAFDAMASGRAYQEVMSLKDILDELLLYSGRQFDPKAVDVFVRAIKTGRIPLAGAVISGQEETPAPMSVTELRDVFADRPEIVLDSVSRATANIVEGLKDLAGTSLAEKVAETMGVMAEEARLSSVPAMQETAPDQRYPECRRYLGQVRDYLIGLVGERLTERLLVEAAGGLEGTERAIVLTILKHLGIDIKGK
jgi:HD-GYP domain-containing protein (c-di-GMP phosphodiesterase class II)